MLSPFRPSEIPPLIHLEEELAFGFYAKIILHHSGKRNVIDLPFLFDCIEEKLRTNKWLLRHLDKPYS